MDKSVIKKIALALAFLLLPSLAMAAGLGKLTVLSGLGQPLKAEIELLAVQKGEAENLSVRLPSAEAFRRANIEYSAALMSIKFGVQQRGPDSYVVILSSSQPMNEPFLDMLIELDWNTGRLVREYTFLLDPPDYKGPQPLAAAPATVAPAPAAPAPAIKTVESPKQPDAGARAPAAERAPAAPAAAPRASKTYVVKQGDTLSRIANANRSEGVSLQQMLIALYRSNADAFDASNINRMRAGKILNIPEADAAAAVDHEEATRTVSAQAADFNDYRRKLAAAVAAAPERADRQRQSASGKITAKVEEKPEPAKDSKDQLKLSKAEQAGKPGARRSPQGLQEDLFAKEKELKEANERIALLEKNVQDMQKLLELKSQSGAQLQQQAAKAGAAKAPEPAKTPAPVKAPEPAKSADAAKAPEPAKAADAAKAPEPAKAAESAKVAEAPKPAPKPAPKAVVPPPPMPEPSLIDEILDNELALYGGGGFLVLLFGGYGYYAWKRKKAMQEMESSVMGAPSMAPDSVFGAAGGAKIDTGAGEIQAELTPAGPAAAVDSGEVDPIAEADVYMAYGRDTQAEDILKEALAKDPSRQAIRGKMLEIYANRKDPKAFEAVAAEIHSATNGEGPEWAKAVALGAQLDPGNPLYGDKATEGESPAVTVTQVVSAGAAAPDLVLDVAAEPAASPGLDFDLGLSEPAPAEAAQPKAEQETQPAAADATADLGFDLDLGGETKPAAAPAPASVSVSGAESGAAAAAPEMGSSIDFDFELPASAAAPAPAEPAAAAAQAPAAESGGGIDFDFNLDLPEPKVETTEAPSAPLDLSSISLDLGTPGEAAPAPDAHWQEVATKLDLAKAYQEMGDKDGARELLGEVVKEGDAAQQQQAQTMLATLG